jgi:hypothetical protein
LCYCIVLDDPESVKNLKLPCLDARRLELERGVLLINQLLRLNFQEGVSTPPFEDEDSAFKPAHERATFGRDCDSLNAATRSASASTATSKASRTEPTMAMSMLIGCR